MGLRFVKLPYYCPTSTQFEARYQLLHFPFLNSPSRLPVLGLYYTGTCRAQCKSRFHHHPRPLLLFLIMPSIALAPSIYLLILTRLPPPYKFVHRTLKRRKQFLPSFLPSSLILAQNLGYADKNILDSLPFCYRYNKHQSLYSYLTALVIRICL